MTKLAIGLGVAAGLTAVAAIAAVAQTPSGGPSPAGPGGGPGIFAHGPGGGPGFGPPMMGPPPSKGAEFRFGGDGRRILVKCADDDNTKACMDAVGPLLNKFIDNK
jgi:hypothetical protein